MKRLLFAFAVAAISATWMGCKPADPPAGSPESETTTSSTTTDMGDFTFVSLSVPNMT